MRAVDTNVLVRLISLPALVEAIWVLSSVYELPHKELAREALGNGRDGEK